MSTDHDLDDIEALDELSALYREARAVRIPEDLDRRVLAAAHRELEAGRFRRRVRWIAPLALAATLVLGVGLVTVLQPPQRELPSEQPAFVTEPSRVQPQSAPAPSGRRLRQAEDLIAPGALQPSLDAGSKPEAASSPPLRPPEAWLADIIELRRQGRITEADTALREFRQHYPDYSLEALREAYTP